MQGLWNLIGKMGSAAQSFPYEVGEKLWASESKSPWSVHHGKKKATGEPVSVFVLDVKASSDQKVKLAKAAIRRLKTLRHPNVVTYIDSLESDTLIYLVTESVTPLEVYLAEEESVKSDLAISWGIHQIAAGLSFLSNDCGLMHGNICMSSVYVDSAGEWKLGGVEYMQPLEPPPGTDVSDITILPALQVYDPPEGRRYSKTNRKVQKWSADMWGLGCLIWEVFNGSLSRSAALKTVGKIPKNLMSNYGELVCANPRIRPNPTKFIESCRAEGHYLNNKFVDANLFLRELQIKDPKEQKKFFSSLSSSLDSFPEPFCKHKILPQLINAFEFAAVGSAVLGPLFKVGKLLEAEEYEKKIVPCVVKLFSSTDRATRIHLLQQLENFVEHLKPQIVDEQIFPHVALGFGDTVPAMREQTVKAMLLLAPKLSEKVISNQLLKHFAKLQMDQEPGIRTNTTVCLGKIANHLSPAVRQKVLVSAFLRPLRDPFPPARTAGIMSLCTTSTYYSLKDASARILPAMCSLTMDPEKKVRDQAFKAIKLFLAKLEKASDDPESALNTTVDQAAGEASSWTGWAVSSLTSKLYKGGKGPETVAAGTTPSATTETQDQARDAAPEPPREKTLQEKAPTKTNVTKENETDSDSGSDDEDWGEDWAEHESPRGIVGELKSDLMAAKEECKTWQDVSATRKSSEEPAGLDEDKTEDSGSDYDDWANDDWSTLTSTDCNKPAKSPTAAKKATTAPVDSTSSGKSASHFFSGAANNMGDAAGFDGDPFVAIGITTSKKTGQASPQRPQSGKSKPEASSRGQNDGGGWGQDDWDTSDWGSKEEVTNSKASKSTSQKGSSSAQAGSDGWGKSEDNWNIDDWGSIGNVHSSKPSSAVKKPPKKEPQAASAGGWDENNWNTDDWESLGDNSGGLSKAELAKKKQEERKQQRLQAMKEKKAAGRGPSKLGGEKIQ